MTTYEQLNGVISLASNSPGIATGYGVQGKLIVDRMKRHGIDVSALSNYGLEGTRSTIQTPYGEVPHYPRGLTLYSADVIPSYHKHHLAGREIPNYVLTLYDTWVYLDAPLADLNIMSWVPIDHVTIPPKVLAWCRKENVTPIAMSKFGQRELEKNGVQSTYIPHAVDTKLFKPTQTIMGYDIREYYGIGDEFLVGMVAANKANGSIHRKAYAENFMAFAIFLDKHSEAKLYVHAEPGNAYGGFNLLDLAKAVGIPKESLLFPDPEKLRFGYTDEEMAALYTGMDVLLHTSYGEGFGVPAIEAQACGTKVIASNWAASQDLVAEDGWLVTGQPFWDEAQKSFFQVPQIPSIIQALYEAYDNRGESKASIEFAKQFDIESVWRWHWLPFLREKLA